MNKTERLCIYNVPLVSGRSLCGHGLYELYASLQKKVSEQLKLFHPTSRESVFSLGVLVYIRNGSDTGKHLVCTCVILFRTFVS